MSNDADTKTRDELFAEFWEAYPKKIGKPLAKAKWNAIVNGGLKTRTLDRDSNTYVEIELQCDPHKIIEAAKRYREQNFDKNTYRFKDNGKYLCHPATWLNQGRFEDS